MEKNNLVLLGLVGALGVGAYMLFNNQDQNIGGGGAGGAKPGSELGSPNYIFNIAAPVFPDFSSFFTDNGTTATAAAKKDSPIIINQADYKPGSLVIVPVKSTIPSRTGGQNFPTVIPIDRSYKPPLAAPAAVAPLKIQNVFGFPVVPHLASSSTLSSKKVIVVPKTGYQAALITAGTPEQQIEQYSIAPRVIKSNGAYKKVM
jgi:hypothetical protein